jgi:hypothetical protein
MDPVKASKWLVTKVSEGARTVRDDQAVRAFHLEAWEPCGPHQGSYPCLGRRRHRAAPTDKEVLEVEGTSGAVDPCRFRE